MKQFLNLALIFLLSIVLLINCGKETETVAKVGSERITLAEFKEVLNERFKRKKLDEISFEEKKEVAQELLNNRLKVLKARELKLDTTSEFKQDIQDKTEQILSQKLFEVQIVDELIPEETLRNIFRFEREKVRAIVIAVNHNGAQRSNSNLSPDQAEKLGQEIVKKLRTGKNAKQLSQQFTDNNMVRRAQGIFDPYKPGVFGFEVDKAVAEANENSIVGPITTEQSVYIIKIENIEKLNNEVSFNSRELDLKRQLYMKYFRQNEGNARYREITEKYKSDLGWNVSQEGIQQFVNKIKAWSSKPNPKDSQFTEEQRNIKLARIADIEITSGYFIDKFKGQFYMRYKRFDNANAIERILHNHVDFLAWTIKAKEKGIDERSDVKEEIEQLERAKLVQLYDSREIRQEVELSQNEIEAYYQAHKEKYMEPAKIQVWEIAVKDQEQANQIHKLVTMQPDNFQKLASKYTQRKGMKSKSGNMGLLSEKSRWGHLVKKAFEAGPNQIVEPFRNGPYYSIVKTGEIQEEQQKSLKEVKNSVERSLRKDRQVKLRQNKIDQLQKEYTYWINESLIRRLT